MNKYIVNFSLFFQLFRFGVVGLTAAIVHFGIVVLIVEMVEQPPLVANMFGFIISFQISYFGHRWWTFSKSVSSHRDAFPKLALVQLINFTANQSLFYVFLLLKFPYPVALFFVLMILPFFTFVSSKFWVFR